MSTTRTPEGEPNFCPLCNREIRIEPSTFPDRDAPCPRCGCLLRFDDPEYTTAHFPVLFEIPEILERLEQWSGQTKAKRLVLDFRHVKVVASEWLGRLITAQGKARTRGIKLALRNVQPEVREVFRITKLDKLIPIEDE